MPKLPSPSGRELIAFFTKQGYVLAGYRGDHVTLWHPEKKRLVTIPLYDAIGRHVMSSILKQSGLGRDEFMRLWEER